MLGMQKTQLLEHLVFVCATLRFWIALKAKPSVMYRMRNRILQNTKGWYVVKMKHKSKYGQRNARNVHRSIYVRKLPVMHTLTCFTTEMHASSVTIVDALPQMPSDLFQNSSSRWWSEGVFVLSFLPCHSICFVFLFHNCTMTLNSKANRINFSFFVHCSPTLLEITLAKYLAI